MRAYLPVRDWVNFYGDRLMRQSVETYQANGFNGDRIVGTVSLIHSENISVKSDNTMLSWAFTLRGETLVWFPRFQPPPRLPHALVVWGWARSKR